MTQDPLQDAIILRDKVLSEELLALAEDDQRLVKKQFQLQSSFKLRTILWDLFRRAVADIDPMTIIKLAHSIGGE